jgi:hypothetical protein
VFGLAAEVRLLCPEALMEERPDGAHGGFLGECLAETALSDVLLHRCPGDAPQGPCQPVPRWRWEVRLLMGGVGREFPMTAHFAGSVCHPGTAPLLRCSAALALLHLPTSQWYTWYAWITPVAYQANGGTVAHHTVVRVCHYDAPTSRVCCFGTINACICYA